MSIQKTKIRLYIQLFVNDGHNLRNFCIVFFLIAILISCYSCKSYDYSIFDENPYDLLEYSIQSIEDNGDSFLLTAKRKGWRLFILSNKNGCQLFDEDIKVGKTVKLSLKMIIPEPRSLPGSRLHISDISLSSHNKKIGFDPKRDLGLFEAINLNGLHITNINNNLMQNCDTTKVRFVF